MLRFGPFNAHPSTFSVIVIPLDPLIFLYVVQLLF